VHDKFTDLVINSPTHLGLGPQYLLVFGALAVVLGLGLFFIVRKYPRPRWRWRPPRWP